MVSHRFLMEAFLMGCAEGAVRLRVDGILKVRGGGGLGEGGVCLAGWGVFSCSGKEHVIFCC